MRKLNLTENITRRFGVEFEFIGAQTAVAREVNAKGIACAIEGYNHNTRSHWKIVTDASISANPYDGNSGELVSPPLRGEDGIKEMRDALEASEKAARVNRQCGFHVHVETSDLTPKQMAKLVQLWALVEDTLVCLLSPSRRSSQWCRSNVMMYSPAAHHYANIEDAPAPVVNQAAQALYRKAAAQSRVSDMFANICGGNRYCMLNLQHVATRGTIEIRAHQGTLSADKAEAWVRLAVALVEAAKEWKFINQRTSKRTGADRLPEVLNYLGIQGETRAYLIRRKDEIAKANANRNGGAA